MTKWMMEKNSSNEYSVTRVMTSTFRDSTKSGEYYFAPEIADVDLDEIKEIINSIEYPDKFFFNERKNVCYWQRLEMGR